jgi:SAM-dependent methyltransferase
VCHSRAENHAAKRVVEHGLADQVTLVIANILEAYDESGNPTSKVQYVEATAGVKSKPLPELGQVDLVTCSFCMTMIPPWKECLEVMVRMLKTGGSLSIVDFTRREDMPGHWTQRLNGWWFANDGVYLDNAHTAALQEHPDLETVWYHETEARVPYTTLQATHYIYTGVKKSFCIVIVEHTPPSISKQRRRSEKATVPLPGRSARSVGGLAFLLYMSAACALS